MKNFKSTFIFGIIVVAVCVFAFMELEKGEKEKAASAKEEQILPSVDVQKVTEIKIETPDKAKGFTLVKEEGEWKVATPLKDRGDSGKITSFIKSIVEEDAKAIKLPEGPIKWESFGLDKPSATITIQAGPTFTLLIGSKESFDGGFYIRKNQEEAVYLGDSSWKSFKEKSLKDLRDKTLYHEAGQVDEIKISYNAAAKKEDVTLIRKGALWAVKGQEKIQLDQSAVSNWIRSLRQFKISDYVSENKDKAELKKHDLLKPQMTVQLQISPIGEGKEKATWTIQLSTDKKDKVQLVTSASDTIYQVEKSKLLPLQKEFSDFRDKKYPFRFNGTEVSEIKFNDDKQAFHVAKQGGVWKVITGKTQELHQDKVKSFIDAVQKIKAERFFKDTKKAKIAGSSKAIEFFDDKSKEVFKLVWGDKVDTEIGKKFNLVYAKSSLAPELLGVNMFSLSDLPINNIFVEKKKEKADKKVDTKKK